MEYNYLEGAMPMEKKSGYPAGPFPVDEIGFIQIAPAKVLAAGTNPQKKHLLHQLVKKVLIHDRRTIEIWYGLPNQASVRTPGHLAPRAGLEPAT